MANNILESDGATSSEEATKAPEKAPEKKPAKKIEAAKESKVVHWTVPLERISALENCRNEPESLSAMGFGLLDLIKMATSEDMDAVREVVKLFETHEGFPASEKAAEEIEAKLVVSASPTVLSLAHGIKKHSQLNPVIMRREKDEFILLAGARRCAAICYNHAKSRVDVADGVEGAELYPATVIAVDREVGKDEGFEISVQENLHTKRLTPLQEAHIYHTYRGMVNPDTQKKWTLSEIAEHLYPGQHKRGTVRSREALLHPRKEPVKDKKGRITKPGTGLTDEDRAMLERGEKTVTWAQRRALGERHYSETGTVQSTRAKAVPLSKMQELFDKSPEKNVERRKAIAECMGLTLPQAIKASNKRIADAEGKDLRMRKRTKTSKK